MPWLIEPAAEFEHFQQHWDDLNKKRANTLLLDSGLAGVAGQEIGSEAVEHLLALFV